MEHLSTLDVRSTSVDEYLELDHMQSGSPPPLCSLERLYLKGRLERLPRWIPKLNSLAKIGLKWSKLNDDNPLDALQGLPNLMQLELVDYYRGEVLEFSTNTFKKLKILHIEQFEGLNMMVVQSGDWPMLEKLTMCKCRNLKLLPAFGPDDLKSLEELLLYDMHKELPSFRMIPKTVWGISMLESYILSVSAATILSLISRIFLHHSGLWNTKLLWTLERSTRQLGSFGLRREY